MRNMPTVITTLPAEVPDVMRALRFEVCGVGLSDGIDSGSAVNIVDIHVEGHWYLLG
jgi:hypothetical protein